MSRGFRWAAVVLLVVLIAAPAQLVAETADASAGHGAAWTMLWIAVILVAAKLAGMVERFGQPAVLGELVIGVILGNLSLIGIRVLEPAITDPILAFLAELGVIILLFQIGLESDLTQMRRVGARALLVAIVGVVLPFVLGTWVVGPLLLPGMSFNAYLFVGAALTATSVGITARVFRDLGVLRSPEAQIVLGAAVIDDVMGLVILAVVSAIVTAGSVTAGAISVIVLKAVGFLAGALVVGRFAAPRLGRLFSTVSSGTGMKLTLALTFALVFAFLAGAIGLAPIVGAFAAGLVLDSVHFKHFEESEIAYEVRDSVAAADPATRESVAAVLDRHSHRHVEELVEPLGHVFVPLFFVLTGMSVNLTVLADLPVVMIALAISAVAIAGKVAAGAVAGPVRKWVVGWGMVPRGEVGLIFATIGAQLGVVPEREFAVIVIMVILTTLIAPPVLTALLRRNAGSGGDTIRSAVAGHPGAIGAEV